MEIQYLDLVLVPMGLALMFGYHVWLFYRVVKNPTTTIIGSNAICRRTWVQAMMEDSQKNGVLAVQTLRNNIMASTLMASMAIMLSSLIAMLMVNSAGFQGDVFVYGDTGKLGFSKFSSILVCFLVSFLMNVQSIRYYSHASTLINVPLKNTNPNLTIDYVGMTVNRGSFFWSLGLRAFYFSCPLFLWIFGPIPMFVCCLVLTFMLYFLDVSLDCGERVEDDDEGSKVGERVGDEEEGRESCNVATPTS